MGGGVGRLQRFGKLPIDFKLQAFYNAETQRGGPEWTMQLQIKALFPK